MFSNQEMNKENIVHIHNTVLFRYKEEQNMSFTGKWIEMETIMLNEISQSHKDNYHIFYLM
jgi:hypothetical protein